MKADFDSASAPHLPARVSITGMMREVLLALVPAAVLHVYFFGIGLLLNIVVCASVALACEALALRLRALPLRPYLGDLSALVTAVLLAFALPPLTPWWVSGCATVFAIVVAKHLYGGVGHNLFNPAMVGYAVALVAFPTYMSGFPAPRGVPSGEVLGVAEHLRYVLSGQLGDARVYDAVTMATPLDHVQSEFKQMRMLSEIRSNDARLHGIAGAGWDWISVGFLVGGIYLLARRIIRWHAPVGVLAGLGVSALILHWVAPDNTATASFHLLSGATMLTAFFIATDPVSGATSPRGRLLFGLGVGLLALLIRTWGKYPDGFAFAILLMNLGAPLIDRITAPRTYGHAK